MPSKLSFKTLAIWTQTRGFGSTMVALRRRSLLTW